MQDYVYMQLTLLQDLTQVPQRGQTCLTLTIHLFWDVTPCVVRSAIPIVSTW